MGALTVISGAILLGWLFIDGVVRKGVMVESLSEVATIERNDKRFTAIVSMASFLVAIGMMLHADGRWTGLLCMMFLFGMLGVAASPHYRRVNAWLHYGGAVLAGVASQVVVMDHSPYCIVSWGFYLTYLIVLRDRYWVLWAEAVCMINIVYYCLT